jgi:hypothetical protein
MDGVVRELADRLSGVERHFPLAVAFGGARTRPGACNAGHRQGRAGLSA